MTSRAYGFGFAAHVGVRITVRTFFVLVAIASLVVTSLFAQQPPVTSIVEQFYPQGLMQLPEELGGREQCFAVYDADASGAPTTIVAGYTNHTEAVIRVLRASAGRFEAVAESRGMAGALCDVTLDDVDSDGRKEVRVDFSVNRTSVSWLFRWDGQQLRSLTPGTGLPNADLVDVDNDGVKELYVTSEVPRFADEPILPGVLYRLRGGQYVETAAVVGLWSFDHTTAAADTSSVPVSLPYNARGPYTLRVVSGRPNRTARVTSAQVFMNGREVVASSAFRARASIIERPVMLMDDNELTVRFADGPPSEMLIVIESKNWKSQ